MRTNHKLILIRSLISAAFTIIGLLYINSGIFSLWVASGPPNPTPGPWIVRGENHFAFGVALLILAIVVPIGIRKLGVRSTLRITTGRILTLLAILVALSAPVGNWFRIDSCLDSGGSWDALKYQCIRESQS